MQSGYGGEMQQFLMDGSLFLPPPPPPPPPQNNTNATASAAKIQQTFYHPHPQPHEFSNLIHPIPITQQLFHHPHHHFQLFNHQHSENDAMLHNGWHREQESAAAAAANNIKEPFWRRPLDIDYIDSKRQSKDKSPAAADDYTNNKINETGASYLKKGKQQHHQENQENPTVAAACDNSYKRLFSELEAIYKPGSGGGCGGGSGSALTADENPMLFPIAINHWSDTSNGTDTSSAKGRRKKKQQERLSSVAAFFDSLAKQVTDRQESLLQNFLEIMERRDQERASRDEERRKEEAERYSHEANVRARERSLAANREASIVSFLEKFTGERISLPEESRKDRDRSALELYNTNVHLNTSRWPKTEVQALIRIRSGLESRFQEPGLKGPLWEEVSAKMAAIGSHRNAKRCKEKWENINKYFRKTKDSGKKRPEDSKTCPYFYQLDQFYSKCNRSSTTSSVERKDNSELLDAIVVSKFGSVRTEMNINEEQEHDDEELERDGEEGEEDSQDQQQCHYEQERIERDQHDTTSFFSH